MRKSLEGLALGDAIGRALRISPTVGDPSFDAPPWPYTDDTEMAIAIADMLAARGHIEQDELARSFAARFDANPFRGYGTMAFWILRQISAGHDWRGAAVQVFGGRGSYGNGAAMRVAPLGAYFADDLPQLIHEAILSAAVTHAHPEGQVGAVATALAAATAAARPDADRSSLVEIARRLPACDVQHLLMRAAQLANASPREAGALLGTGIHISAQDTVPFALWCAFGHLRDYRAAQLAAMAGFESGASDRDTICAIVGGVVAMSCAESTIPADWVAQQEPLPEGPAATSLGC